MEVNRYNHNNKLYLFGMFCCVMSIGFILLFLYTLPNLVWGWRYDVPEFIAFWHESFTTYYMLSDSDASRVISAIFLLIGLMFGYGAYYASKRIDDEIYHIEKKSKWVHTVEFKQSFRVFLKIAGLILLILAIIYYVQWLLYIPPNVS